MVQRHDHDRGAELDPAGLRCEVAQVAERVGQDPVLIREVMLRNPDAVEPVLLRGQHLVGHARVDRLVRIRRRLRVRVRCEQQSNLHVSLPSKSLAPAHRATIASVPDSPNGDAEHSAALEFWGAALA